MKGCRRKRVPGPGKRRFVWVPDPTSTDDVAEKARVYLKSLPWGRDDDRIRFLLVLVDEYLWRKEQGHVVGNRVRRQPVVDRRDVSRCRRYTDV